MGQEPHLERAIKTTAAPSALLMGSLFADEAFSAFDWPLLCRVASQLDPLAASKLPVDVVADPAFLPFANESFHTVFLCHSLEQTNDPHQSLREAHRVLMPEGYLVLIGFNPVSLLGLQARLGIKGPYNGRGYRLKRVQDWLRLLNFDVVGSAMFQYGPLTKRPHFQRLGKRLERIGDRWLPLLGGAYMLTARRREEGMNLIGPLKGRPTALTVKPATAKTALNTTHESTS